MGFKMRSGNGPLAFKNMGSSSPAKQPENFGEGVDEAQLRKNAANEKSQAIANEAKAKAESIKTKNAAEKAKKAADTKASAKERKEYASTKHKGQLKKEAKLARISEKRELKGKEGKTSKQIRLQKEVDMNIDDYTANQKQKKADFQDAANRAAISIDPKTSSVDVANFDESVRSRGSQAILDAERESLTRARNDEQVETLEGGEVELPEDKSSSQTEGGEVKFLPSTKTTKKYQ